MNIIYLHRTRGKDVEGVHIREIIYALKERGHTVSVSCLPGTDPTQDRCFAASTTFRQNSKKKSGWDLISRYTPESIFECFELLQNLYAYWNLNKNIKRHVKIDLIFERYSLFSMAGIWAAKRYGIPIILEVNDASFVERVRPLQFARFAAKMEHIIFNHADAIVTVSKRFKEMILAFGQPPEKVTVIPNAINPKIFSDSNTGDEIKKRYGLKNKLVIGFVGSMAPWHGVQLLLELVDKIYKQQDNVVFILVGDSSRLSSHWKEYIKSKPDLVKLAGAVPHATIPDYIAAMDIAIMPHSNEYGSPMKIFEYMAMGKAVVAPRLGPLTEVIDHGHDGFLVTPGDLDDLYRTITVLLKDSVLRHKFGRQAAQKIRKKHTWGKNAEKILCIFEEISRHKRFNSWGPR